MCCNGVLFQSVRLQAADSARQLSALGLKVKTRKDGAFFPQPCPAHQESHCTIYASRPTRCRLFECRQLLAVDKGTLSEEAALEKIREARRRSARVEELLRQAGETRPHKAFATRYASVFTEPLDPDLATVRAELETAMQELESLLASDFRVEA